MENILHLTGSIKELTRDELKLLVNSFTPDQVAEICFKSFCRDFFCQDVEYINHQLIPNAQELTQKVLKIIQQRERKPMKGLRKYTRKNSTKKPRKNVTKKAAPASVKLLLLNELPATTIANIANFLNLYDLMQFELISKQCFLAIRTLCRFQTISLPNIQSLIEYSLASGTQNHWIRFKYINTFALKLTSYDYERFGTQSLKFHTLPMIEHVENLILDLWVENEKVPPLFQFDFRLCNFCSVKALYIEDLNYLVNCGGLSSMIALEFLQIHYLYPTDILSSINYPKTLKGLCLLNNENEQWLNFKNVPFCDTIQSITIPAMDFATNRSKWDNLQELCIESIKVCEDQRFPTVKRLHLRNCENMEELSVKNMALILDAFPNLEHLSVDFSSHDISNIAQLSAIIAILDILVSCFQMMSKPQLRISLWIHSLPRDLLIHSFFMIVDKLMHGNIVHFQFDIVYFANTPSEISTSYQRLFQHDNCRCFVKQLNDEFYQLSVTNCKNMQIQPWIYDYSQFFDTKYTMYDLLSVKKGFSSWTMF